MNIDKKDELQKALVVFGIELGICIILVSIALISIAGKGAISEIDWSIYKQGKYIGLTLASPIILYPFYSVIARRSIKKENKTTSREPVKIWYFVMIGVLLYLSVVFFIALIRIQLQI